MSQKELQMKKDLIFWFRIFPYLFGLYIWIYGLLRGISIILEQEVEGTLWIIIGSLVGVSLSVLSQARRWINDYEEPPDFKIIDFVSWFCIGLVILVETCLFFIGFVLASFSVVGAIIMAIEKDVSLLDYCAPLFWGLSVSLSIYHHGLGFVNKYFQEENKSK